MSGRAMHRLRALAPALLMLVAAPHLAPAATAASPVVAASPHYAGTAEVYGIRTASHGSRQRVVLDLTGHASFAVTQAADQSGWTIDIAGQSAQSLTEALARLVGAPDIAAATLRRQPDRTVVSLRFAAPMKAAPAFTIDADAGAIASGTAAHRIVLDFTPSTSPSPVPASTPAPLLVAKQATVPANLSDAAHTPLPSASLLAMASARTGASRSLAAAPGSTYEVPLAIGPAFAGFLPLARPDRSDIVALAALAPSAGGVPASGRPARISLQPALSDQTGRARVILAAPPPSPVRIEPAMPDWLLAQNADDRVRLTGMVEAEARWFPSRSADGVGSRWFGSVALEPTFEANIFADRDDQRIRITGFARLDTATGSRTHWDIREAKWTGQLGPVDVTLGADRQFWGVTESVHLVNVLNQIDTLEDVDGEDYLGQPMAAVSWPGRFGTLSGYVLPYFRERRFPGRDDRPNGPLPVDRALTSYQSGSEQWHVGWAARWSHSHGPFDLGLSHFSGTSREPLLRPTLNGAGAPVLAPHYELIDQSGLDLQVTSGALLLKLEAIHRWAPSGDFGAVAGGAEYTLFNLGGSGADLGLLAEYSHDERGPAGPSPFNSDMFVGLRFAGNDVSGTQALVGAIFDLEQDSQAFTLEASRRIGSSLRVSLDGRLFAGSRAADPLNLLADDDFLQVKAQWFF